jgi:hypothetical protein
VKRLEWVDLEDPPLFYDYLFRIKSPTPENMEE